jgi:hypothetical protein
MIDVMSSLGWREATSLARAALEALAEDNAVRIFWDISLIINTFSVDGFLGGSGVGGGLGQRDRWMDERTNTVAPWHGVFYHRPTTHTHTHQSHLTNNTIQNKTQNKQIQQTKPNITQANPEKFRADLVNIAKTTLSSKLLCGEKAHFGTFWSCFFGGLGV